MQNFRPNVIAAMLFAATVVTLGIFVVAFGGVSEGVGGMILTAAGAFVGVTGAIAKELVAPNKSDLQLVLEHMSKAAGS